MKIPKKVKVGGLTYKVKITSNLQAGQANATAEICHEQQLIRIKKGNPTQHQQRDFLHEIIHAINYDLGYRRDDEKQVDEMAGALYALIVDNPGMFSYQ